MLLIICWSCCIEGIKNLGINEHEIQNRRQLNFYEFLFFRLKCVPNIAHEDNHGCITARFFADRTVYPNTNCRQHSRGDYVNGECKPASNGWVNLRIHQPIPNKLNRTGTLLVHTRGCRLFTESSHACIRWVALGTPTSQYLSLIIFVSHKVAD